MKGSENEMRKVDKVIEAATPHIREFYQSCTDAELNSQLERAHRLVIVALQRVEDESGGLSLPEIALKRCHDDRGAPFGELPSPRGKTVKHLVPAGYRGFEQARNFCIMKELVWNLIPWLVPLPLKVQIAAEQYIKAAEMLRADHTRQSQVRFLIAEAQYYVLHRVAYLNERTAWLARPRTNDLFAD
jgi:hypothetical protein